MIQSLTRELKNSQIKNNSLILKLQNLQETNSRNDITMMNLQNKLE
jgi:hypothetical protein